MRARIIREFKFELAIMAFLAGTILFLVGLQATLLQDIAIPVVWELADGVTSWGVWVVVLGLVLLLGGGWTVGDGVSKRREFERLIGTGSKAAFVRNLDRLEELAWILSAEHERRVWEKKKELRIH